MTSPLLSLLFEFTREDQYFKVEHVKLQILELRGTHLLLEKLSVLHAAVICRLAQD